jgi:hypothetical protein
MLDYDFGSDVLDCVARCDQHMRKTSKVRVQNTVIEE